MGKDGHVDEGKHQSLFAYWSLQLPLRLARVSIERPRVVVASIPAPLPDPTAIPWGKTKVHVARNRRGMERALPPLPTGRGGETWEKGTESVLCGHGSGRGTFPGVPAVDSTHRDGTPKARDRRVTSRSTQSMTWHTPPTNKNHVDPNQRNLTQQTDDAPRDEPDGSRHLGCLPWGVHTRTRQVRHKSSQT